MILRKGSKFPLVCIFIAELHKLQFTKSAHSVTIVVCWIPSISLVQKL